MSREWSVNYEVLPTKRAVELSAKIPPQDSISVTCRPTWIEDTIVFVEAMRRPVIPNVAFGRFKSPEHFNESSDRLKKAGVTSIMAIGGDGKPTRPDIFPHALAGLQAYWERGEMFETVYVGGYPLGNRAMDADPTWVLLQKQSFAKEHAIPMSIVTQVTPDPESVISWIEHIRRRGVDFPVVVGLPGKLNATSMKNLIKAVGLWDNLKFFMSKPRMAVDLFLMSLRGFDPVPYITKLTGIAKKEHNITGIRIFTLGNITASVARVTSIE